MKNQRLISTAIATVGVLSFVCLIGYHLALHDIFSDYVSPKVLEKQVGLTGASLPGWTGCPQEWWFVRIGFWPMLAFHVLGLAGFVRYTGRNTRNPPKSPWGDVSEAAPRNKGSAAK